jgi:hypothetical protein
MVIDMVECDGNVSAFCIFVSETLKTRHSIAHPFKVTNITPLHLPPPPTVDRIDTFLVIMSLVKIILFAEP